MTDKELLERAAKALGVELSDRGELGLWFEDGELGQYDEWNPLACDRQALILAASLELEVSFGRCGAIIYMKGGINIEEISDDYMPATRRAIVRAAAQLA